MKKSIKITIIVISILVGLIIIDTLQARVFNNSPIIKITKTYSDAHKKNIGIFVETDIYVGITQRTYFRWENRNNHFKENTATNNDTTDPLITCLISQLGAYITSERLSPIEVELDELIDIDIEKVDYSLVKITDNIGIYVIIKTTDDNIISTLEKYLDKEYKYYKTSTINDYKIYVYTSGFSKDDGYDELFESDIKYCEEK